MGLSRVLVMGAINQDQVARVSAHPALAETVVAVGLDVYPGGKGANQATAAATSGFDVDVQMLGAVGDDDVGDLQLEALVAAGVDVSMVRRVLGIPTGRAHITVDADGRNSIVVVLGANAYVSPANLHGVAAPDVVVAQTEIGSAPIEATVAFASAGGSRVIINNAPVIGLNRESLSHADPLVVNRVEARDMLLQLRAGSPLDDPGATAEAIREASGAISVVVTLGADGCVIADRGGVRTAPADPVPHVVDTTGAGNAFVGTLAASLATKHEIDESVRYAASAAARTITCQGARSPTASLSGMHWLEATSVASQRNE